MEIDRPIIIALVLFAILVLNFFWVVPSYNALQALQANLALKKAQFNAQHDYYEQITKDYFLLMNDKDGIQKIDDALPPSPDLGEVSYYFQKTAQDNGLIFKNLTLAQVTQDNDLKDITFSLEISGNYASLQNFIIALEQSARLFEVSSISFGSVALQTTPTTSTTLGTATSTSPTSKTSAPSIPASQFQNPQIFDFHLGVTMHSY